MVLIVLDILDWATAHNFRSLILLCKKEMRYVPIMHRLVEKGASFFFEGEPKLSYYLPWAVSIIWPIIFLLIFFFSLSFQALTSFRDSGSPSLHSLFKEAVSGGPVDFCSMKTPHDNCTSLIPSCPAPGDHLPGGLCECHPLELKSVYTNDYNVGQCGSTKTHHAEA